MNQTSVRLLVASAMVLWLARSLSAGQILLTSTFGGHTYYLLGGDGPAGTGVNYTDASIYAASLGGFLVTVNDSLENAYLYDTFADAQFPGFVPVDGLYIGYSDAAVEGTFVWQSGAISLYTNWAVGEPNNTHNREDWATIVGKRAASASLYGPGTWNDIPNIAATGEVGANPSAPFYAIAEKVPEPPAIQIAFCALASFAVFWWRRLRSEDNPTNPARI